MDSQCLWEQQLTKKDDKDSRDFEKNKSSQNPLANTSLLLSSENQSLLVQAIKKEQNIRSCRGKLCCQGQDQGQNTPTTSVNAIVIRKDKDKDKKDLANNSATIVSRRFIMPTSVPKRNQKTSGSLDNFHIDDWE